MVRTFVATGDAEAVRARFARVSGFADSLCIVPPGYSLPPEKVMGYGIAIATALYSR
jgi:hypothetical protein